MQTEFLLNCLAFAVEEQKRMEAYANSIKEKIKDLMEEEGVKNVENDSVKCSIIPGSTTTTVDTLKLKKKEPELWEELLKDYPKETTRKASVRVTVKANEGITVPKEGN